MQPILFFEHDPSDPPARVADWLDAAGVPHVTLRPHAGDAVPDDPSEYAATIMLGGAQSANSDDDFGWRADSIGYLQKAVASEHPTLCLCLGGQLLTHAMGGRVERGEHGREVGAMLVGRKDVSYSDDLFAQLPMAPDVIQFHGESITSLPPGAVHLMSGPVYDYQAYRLGRRAWATQFHIETTPEIFEVWAEKSRESLERQGIDVDQLVARTSAVHPDVEEVWAPFIQRFARLAQLAATDAG